MNRLGLYPCQRHPLASNILHYSGLWLTLNSERASPTTPERLSMMLRSPLSSNRFVLWTMSHFWWNYNVIYAKLRVSCNSWGCKFQARRPPSEHPFQLSPETFFSVFTFVLISDNIPPQVGCYLTTDIIKISGWRLKPENYCPWHL